MQFPAASSRNRVRRNFELPERMSLAENDLDAHDRDMASIRGTLGRINVGVWALTLTLIGNLALYALSHR